MIMFMATGMAGNRLFLKSNPSPESVHTSFKIYFAMMTIAMIAIAIEYVFFDNKYKQK